MQHNLPPKAKSHLIKQTEEAQKKAQHRLIGSIFLLLIALVILLNVTAKIKPIPVNPEIIVVKPPEVASAALVTTSIPKIQQNTIPQQPQPLTEKAAQEEQAQTARKESVTTGTGTTTSTDTTIIATHPQIVSEKISHKPTPEDILNGHNNTVSKINYFIQIISNSDKASVVEAKQQLHSAHPAIPSSKVHLQTITSKGGTILYRLRIGSFATYNQATQTLQKIQQGT